MVVPVNSLIKNQYKGVPAYDFCPVWLKIKYRQAVKFICQECGKHEEEVGKLEPHRIVRGHKGGKYTVCSLSHKSNNIKVVCNRCHKIFHGKEPGCY